MQRGARWRTWPALRRCVGADFFFEWGGTKIGDPQIGVVWTCRGNHPNPVVYQVYHPSIFNRQLKKVPRGIPPFLGKPKWAPVVHHGSPIIYNYWPYRIFLGYWDFGNGSIPDNPNWKYEVSNILFCSLLDCELQEHAGCGMATETR